MIGIDKKIGVFIVALLASCTCTFAGGEKVVERSGKCARWIYSSGKDYIVVSAEAADLETAKDKAMIMVKKQILSSIAEGVRSKSTITTHELGNNRQFDVLETYESQVETKGALIPFISEVSVVKVEDYYWEKLKLKKQKTFRYRYHIKYPFNQFDLARMSDSFLEQEHRINEQIADFSADDFSSYASVEQMIQRLQQVRLFKNQLLEGDPRIVMCQNIEKVYNTYLKSITLRLLSVNQKELIFAPFYGEKKLIMALQPKLSSNCLTNVQYVPNDGVYVVSYDFQTACYDDEENYLEVGLNISGNKIRNRFIVK